MPRTNYTAAEYADMILIYGECHQNAALAIRTYKERYGANRVCPSDGSIIIRAVLRIRENKPLVSTNEGVRSKELSIKQEERIYDYFDCNPSGSLREAARRFKVSHTTIRKVKSRRIKDARK